MVSTHLKNISQNGNLPQIGVKIKNIWNHRLVLIISLESQGCFLCFPWHFVTFAHHQGAHGQSLPHDASDQGFLHKIQDWEWYGSMAGIGVFTGIRENVWKIPWSNRSHKSGGIPTVATFRLGNHPTIYHELWTYLEWFSRMSWYLFGVSMSYPLWSKNAVSACLFETHLDSSDFWGIFC